MDAKRPPRPPNTRTEYLVCAAIALLLAGSGFEGALATKGGFSPVVGGAVCFLIGAYFLYRAITTR